jgi:hypothetical protein
MYADKPLLLKAAFELKLREGWRPELKKKKVKEVPITVIKALNRVWKQKYLKDVLNAL